MGVQLIYLDPNDTSGTVTLSNNNLTASMPSGTIIRANYAHIKGKYYFEVKLDSGTTIMQFGIASKLISIPSPTSVYVRCINGGNGNRYPENTSYGTGWVVGDVIGVALDLDSGKLEFYKNGVNMGISHTDLNNLISQYGEIVPYFRSGSTNPVITVNFGASAFKYTVPVGYYPYNYSTSNKFLISSENEYYSLTPEVYSTETAIPTMTSNTTPNGRAFASSVSSSTYEPWRAFDKADGGTYLSVGATTSGYLGYEFIKNTMVYKYSIKSYANNFAGMPKDWTFEGSNDDENWAVLDTQVNQIWTTANTDKDYTIDINKIGSYKMYRLNWTANNNISTSNSIVNEFKMFEYTLPKLFELPNQSEQNFLNYGMSKDTSINLSKSKILERRYIVQDNAQLGSGKVFKQKIDTTKIPIKKASIT